MSVRHVAAGSVGPPVRLLGRRGERGREGREYKGVVVWGSGGGKLA